MSQIAIALQGAHITFKREDVELPDGVLGLLADIAEPISLASDEFVVIPSTVTAKTDGSVIGLIEVHAGRHRDDHEDPTFGSYFAPKPNEDTVVLVTVTNHTASTVIIRPASRIGLMTFRELRLAEHGDANADEGQRPDIAANDADASAAVGVVYQPRHIDAGSPPQYATTGSAALDLRADLETAVDLAPGERRLIATGLRLAIPEGFEGQVRPRSGLALKHGITIANAPGTVDSDYRGDVGVILINAGGESFTVEPGDRIAQILFAPVARLPLDFRNELDQTDRGTGGFGSTGRR